jgi:Fe-S-cluster containining protein
MSDELERQVERGSLFTHTALSGLAQRTFETESIVLGLVDVLLGKGVIDEDGLTAAANDARDAMDERGETTMPGIQLRLDSPEIENETVEVDCAARMPVCHAICCKLNFALTAPEIEGGKVKWDLGRPYLIRHDEEGFCTHCDRGTGACGIYEDRPQICRSYSCAGDTRIWKDFDNMVLNDEWIAENLVEEGPRLLATAMVPHPEG